MLRRKSVTDLQSGRVGKKDSYIVCVMRFYPRGVPKSLMDEYVRALAPDEKLFAEFKDRQRKLANHNSAFFQVDYEKRFVLSPVGLLRLREFSALARERDVVLICQCRDFERCHCDLLLLTARKEFGAETQGLLFEYPDFQKRLEADSVSIVTSAPRENKPRAAP